MTSLTFTQIRRNKELFEQAKARNAALTVTVNGSAPQRRPKWAFQVLALVNGPQGPKVEVFDDYTFAQRWTQGFGGGVVYPRDLVADYTTSSVTLKEGLALAVAEIEPLQLDLF